MDISCRRRCSTASSRPSRNPERRNIRSSCRPTRAPPILWSSLSRGSESAPTKAATRGPGLRVDILGGQLELARRRSWRGRSAWCGASGRRRRRERLEIRGLGQLLLRHWDLQLCLVDVASRDFAKLGQVDCNLLGPKAEDTAHAHNEGSDLPTLIKQDVDNVPHLLVVRAENGGAPQLRRQPLVPALGIDDLRTAGFRRIGERTCGTGARTLWRLRERCRHRQRAYRRENNKCFGHVRSPALKSKAESAG